MRIDFVSRFLSDVYCEYNLYFVKNDLSIPYEQLKEFMKQNNLK